MNTQEVNEYIKNNTHLSYSELSDILGISYGAVKKRYYRLKLPKKEVVYMKPSKEVEKYLKEKGVRLEEVMELLEAKKPNIEIIERKTKIKYSFGIVSDTHLADRACALSALTTFYKLCSKRGIKDIVHAGDIMTGINVYPGQINDLVCFGFDDHLKYAVEHYPKIKGIKTYFISGNHDESYKKGFGIDFGKHLNLKRNDLIYLGMYDATITLNGVVIGLHHGGGGNSYALSYKLQKYIEKLGSGQKPQIYILGHYHGSFYMFYRNVHCLLPGCWQKPNDFSVRHGLPNQLGGWIINLEIADDDKNSIINFKSEFIPFYE